MATFEGEVTCQGGNGAINLTLRGQTGPAGHSSDLQVLFCGATVSLPQTMRDVRVAELDGLSTPRRYRIESHDMSIELHARSMQAHRGAAAQLFGAVPAARVPWRIRAGWTLLLSLLRLPGVGPLILGRRGTP